ncbi:NAD(P)H-binding protein [Maribellus comscasis]|uniref:NAD(P)H-binding protein n=1 Tax=Maribellus comscasis TaxID=2681766 RepID=A0A6I6JY61_9BACT|nr:NAD(P)H-binding protein [Maribellus comscasis]QGY47481.1 NAD(P)H-binding protein [Maribellus comscasis]
MKISVIGASGMLAKPVIQQLEEKGFQLRLFSRTVNPSMFINDYDIIQGDIFNPADLHKAVNGCDAIHISISKLDEKKAAGLIVNVAKEKGIQLISMVSGCTVSEENRWFKFIDNKFHAEELIKNSGIPWIIFRPTWFFESLDLMIRNGKATMIGEQPHPYHWVAADDFARMVAEAYSKKQAQNRVFSVYGPETYLMKDILEKYCQNNYPEIKKVSVAPIPLLKVIAGLTGNKELKEACKLFAYFQKVKEPEIPSETNEILGQAELNFENWLKQKSE